MWIKSQEGKLINLDKVDAIEITPMNLVMCKFMDKGICLGNFKTEEHAREFLSAIEDMLDSNNEFKVL